MSERAVFARLEEIARTSPRRIVFPEAATDERVLQAAAEIAALKIATPVVVGTRLQFEGMARAALPLDGFTLLDPSEDLDETAGRYVELRAGREGLGLDAARVVVQDPLYAGALAVAAGVCDGLVAGATVTTADVLRAAIRCVGLLPGIGTLSSFFAMQMPKEAPVGARLLLFADCAVVVEPTVDQLADIAITTADLGSKLFDMEPHIAMLSFSTRGSAVHPTVTKMRDAARLVNARRPDLPCDGELQVDAALVAAVGERKAPGSSIAGKANVLIFPDLDAGNIGYKLVQRIGHAAAIGPILQGTAKPVSDLSRGCSIHDIIDAATLTAARANLGV